MAPLKLIWKSRRFKLPVGLYRVEGDSMVPTLSPGNIVVVLRNGRASAGDVVVFYHERLNKVKRLYAWREDGAYLLGDNLSASTDSRRFGAIECGAIIGRVIWPRAKTKVLI